MKGPSLAILGHAVVQTLRISVPAVVHGRRGTLTVAECDEMLDSWSARLLDRAGVELHVSGVEHLDAEPGPYVTVSNHQSLYDIPVLFQSLPFSLRMAAKTELFQTPIWGRAMSAAGFVEIDRKNGKKALLSLRKAGERMKQDQVSLHIAPEGTRSEDGEVGPFKNGAFSIARALNFPIVPVAISGAIDVHRSGSFQVRRNQRVEVRILPLLQPKGFRSTDSLRDAVRAPIVEALEQMRAAAEMAEASQSHKA